MVLKRFAERFANAYANAIICFHRDTHAGCKRLAECNALQVPDVDALGNDVSNPDPKLDAELLSDAVMYKEPFSNAVSE